ncbi:hypothetical protein I7I53_07030 [Histoplasma capsulatum var. duboisii H88]|uniref:Uncharacterized protein n=1 Tax=Ajellomyces capsulatus (strain H88) TaxID=544711 RepID=A0A8A1LB78_AJEC8|nr:hypothetical protein I7I53_07030 [Histoplasma capsulatum var. duboisii H88]
MRDFNRRPPRCPIQITSHVSDLKSSHWLSLCPVLESSRKAVQMCKAMFDPPWRRSMSHCSERGHITWNLCGMQVWCSVSDLSTFFWISANEYLGLKITARLGSSSTNGSGLLKGGCWLVFICNRIFKCSLARRGFAPLTRLASRETQGPLHSQHI